MQKKTPPKTKKNPNQIQFATVIQYDKENKARKIGTITGTENLSVYRNKKQKVHKHGNIQCERKRLNTMRNK